MNTRRKYTVYGYMREFQLILSSYHKDNNFFCNIPDLVITECLLFYGIYAVLVKEWLTIKCGFPQYYYLFIENGYDSIHKIKKIKNREQLKEIGILLKGHQYKIWAEIMKLSEFEQGVHGNINGYNLYNECLLFYDNTVLVKEWLTTEVGLVDRYYNIFIENGYDSIDIIKEIKGREQLEEIGILLKGHQCKIFAEIKKLIRFKKDNQYGMDEMDEMDEMDDMDSESYQQQLFYQQEFMQMMVTNPQQQEILMDMNATQRKQYIQNEMMIYMSRIAAKQYLLREKRGANKIKHDADYINKRRNKIDELKKYKLEKEERKKRVQKEYSDQIDTDIKNKDPMSVQFQKMHQKQFIEMMMTNPQQQVILMNMDPTQRKQYIHNETMIYMSRIAIKQQENNFMSHDERKKRVQKEYSDQFDSIYDPISVQFQMYQEQLFHQQQFMQMMMTNPQQQAILMNMDPTQRKQYIQNEMMIYMSRIATKHAILMQQQQSSESKKVEERSFEVMKYTDKQSEYIIFGFIHEIQKILYDTDKIIPSLIYHICLAFYFIDYQWDPNIKSPGLEISRDGKIVTNFICDETWQGIVAQNTFSSGRHCFEIEIINDAKTTNSWRCIIGVVPVTFDPNITAWIGSQDSWGYIAGTGGKCYIHGKSISYGDKYGANDRIKCLIDFNQHTIEFFKNDKYQGIAFNNLSGTVRPAVSIMGHWYSVKIYNVGYKNTVSKLSTWLSSIVCLPQYYEAFIINGYESLEQIFNIKDKAELNKIGVTLKGHQTKLMWLINRGRNMKENNNNTL